MIDPRLVIKSFGVSDTGQLKQVSVSGFVFCQQNEMKCALPAAFAFPFLPMAIGDISFDSDDRFDSLASAGMVELDSAEHVSMIGQGECLHAMFASGSNQSRDGVYPIQQTVMTVDVKVTELVGYFGQGSSGCRSRCRDGVPGNSVVGLNGGTGKPHGDLMPHTVDVILDEERGYVESAGRS